MVCLIHIQILRARLQVFQNSLFNSALKQSSAVRRDIDTFAESPGTSSPALQGQHSSRCSESSIDKVT